MVQLTRYKSADQSRMRIDYLGKFIQLGVVQLTFQRQTHAIDYRNGFIHPRI